MLDADADADDDADASGTRSIKSANFGGSLLLRYNTIKNCKIIYFQ